MEKNKRNNNWCQKYELAKKYYEYYGNLEIPVRFKTINGIDYDKNGVALGSWIHVQRQAYKGIGTYTIDKERIKLLEEIGINFEQNNNNIRWHQKYELAKKYYERYGNLEISSRFKTLDGIDYDENGIQLGAWITSLRSDRIKKNLSKEQINLLTNIGMRFECTSRVDSWMKYYNLAKTYYEHYGDLEIPVSFKTIDGINYDENGHSLGAWLSAQRQAYQKRGSRIIEKEQIELLNRINMRFEIINAAKDWLYKYELAKKYYEHYGNLEISSRFKTVNGIDYNENGIQLGVWIAAQRQAYQKNGGRILSSKQIELLTEIGMRFECNVYENNWYKKYELTKKYYEYYGNINIASDFKTSDGINYDENGITIGTWLASQKQAYKGRNNTHLDVRKVQLLESIGIKWFSDNIDNKLQSEKITENNLDKKRRELESRFYSLLCCYERSGITYDNLSAADIKEINNDFLENLDISKKLTLKK